MIRRIVRDYRYRKYSARETISRWQSVRDGEEKHIFPILGNEHELVKRALAEHRRLMRLFEAENDWVKNIHLIEEELESHIRFEERVLFNEIQEVATLEQLEQVSIHHTEEKFVDNVEDAFWI